MALQLRPNCEYCDKDLPPDSTEARICSYECSVLRGLRRQQAPQCLSETAAAVLFHDRYGRQGNGVPAYRFEKHPYRPSACTSNTASRMFAAHSAKLRDIPPEKR